MAKFRMQLPEEIIKDCEYVLNNTKNIFGGMTRAGAEVVEKNIKANVPDGIRNSNMMNNLVVTKTYTTPTDGGINNKVGFFGYFIGKDKRTKVAPLIANVFEYGRKSSKFPKHPFMRKSFKRKEIESAMLDAQSKISKGILWTN